MANATTTPYQKRKWKQEYARAREFQHEIWDAYNDGAISVREAFELDQAIADRRPGQPLRDDLRSVRWSVFSATLNAPGWNR